jgi:hypothetical protein
MFSTHNIKRDILWLIIIFVIGQSFLTYFYHDLGLSPVISPDSRWYVAQAEHFPDFSKLSNVGATGYGYVGFVALISAGKLFSSTSNAIEWFTVFLNSVFVIGASFTLLRLGSRWGFFAGWFMASFFLLNPQIAQWTRYVLTEATFFSGLVFVIAASLEARARGKPLWLPLWIIVIIVSSIRPNGIVIIPAVITFMILTANKSSFFKFSVLSLSITTFIIGALTLPHLRTGGSSDDWAFGPKTWNGEVIAEMSEMRLSMPIPSDSSPTRIAFLRYLFEHPIAVINLTAHRIGWELVQVKPWYGWRLNSLITLFMIVFYFFGFIGWFSSRRSNLNKLIWSLSLPSVAIVAVSWASYEGRFGWWFMVPWIIWSGIGFQKFIDHFVIPKFPTLIKSLSKYLRFVMVVKRDL